MKRVECKFNLRAFRQKLRAKQHKKQNTKTQNRKKFPILNAKKKALAEFQLRCRKFHSLVCLPN